LGAVPSLTLLDVCEKLSAGWTRSEAIAVAAALVSRVECAHRQDPSTTTKHCNTASHLALQLRSAESTLKSSQQVFSMVCYSYRLVLTLQTKRGRRRNIAILRFNVTKNVNEKRRGPTTRCYSGSQLHIPSDLTNEDRGRLGTCFHLKRVVTLRQQRFASQKRDNALCILQDVPSSFVRDAYCSATSGGPTCQCEPPLS
jgi:hypothetical protein